jgi:hypothetical protein
MLLFRTVVSVGAATAAVYFVYKHIWSNCGRTEADEEREANSIVDQPEAGTAEALVDNDAGRDTMSTPLADECPICITEIRYGLLFLCGGACSPQYKQPENDFFPLSHLLVPLRPAAEAMRCTGSGGTPHKFHAGCLSRWADSCRRQNTVRATLLSSFFLSRDFFVVAC